MKREGGGKSGVSRTLSHHRRVSRRGVVRFAFQPNLLPHLLVLLLTSFDLSIARLSAEICSRLAPINSGDLTKHHSAKCDRCWASVSRPTPT